MVARDRSGVARRIERIACCLQIVISSMVAVVDESNAVNACDTQKVVEVERRPFDESLCQFTMGDEGFEPPTPSV